jgi:TrmH family RNA methyltransferase
VLEGARRFGSLAEAVAPFRRVVGTTSARDRALAVPVVTPRELAVRLPGGGADLPTALVFGPEVGGLTNDELALCHLVVTVPCAPVQPTLNLAQAVLITAYELFLARGAEPLADTKVEAPAPAGAVDGLFEHLVEILEEVGFARDTTFHGVLRDLRQLAGRARPTEREVTILRGVLRRVRNALRRAAGGGPAGADPGDNIPPP